MDSKQQQQQKPSRSNVRSSENFWSLWTMTPPRRRTAACCCGSSAAEADQSPMGEEGPLTPSMHYYTLVCKKPYSRLHLQSPWCLLENFFFFDFPCGLLAFRYVLLPPRRATEHAQFGECLLNYDDLTQNSTKERPSKS